MVPSCGGASSELWDPIDGFDLGQDPQSICHRQPEFAPQLAHGQVREVVGGTFAQDDRKQPQPLGVLKRPAPFFRHPDVDR